MSDSDSFVPASPGEFGKVDISSGDIVTVYPDRESCIAAGGRYYWIKSGAVKDIVPPSPFVRSPARAGRVLSSARARSMQEKRFTNAVKAARAGLRDLPGANNSSLRAWARIVEAQGKLALDASKGRDSTQAARFVGKAADFIPTGHDSGGPGGDSPGLRVDLSPDLAMELLQVLAELRRGR